jgi:hypothetical protein
LGIPIERGAVDLWLAGTVEDAKKLLKRSSWRSVTLVCALSSALTMAALTWPPDDSCQSLINAPGLRVEKAEFHGNLVGNLALETSESSRALIPDSVDIGLLAQAGARATVRRWAIGQA